MGKANRHTGSNQSPRDPYEAVLQAKKSELLKAERAYWEKQKEIRAQQRSIADLFGKAEPGLPSDLSSTVWALRDGAAFVRYKSNGTPGVGFRTANITLEQWGKEGLFVPLVDREVSLARLGVAGLGHFVFIDCSFDGVVVPYAEFSYMRYGDEHGLPSVERAVVDYQLAFLGRALATKPLTQAFTPDSVIDKLQARAAQFEHLLTDANTMEEQLQIFIKENPFIIHPSAQIVPKQKLGEEFVTDFVLVAPYEQGPIFYFVEIERASLPVLTKDCLLSGQANHALKQTRDWSIWLEANQAYLRGKLPGLESPKYVVIIGRSTGMSEQQKAYLRAYNRDWKNTTLYTYDDLLTQFRATIARLREISLQ